MNEYHNGSRAERLERYKFIYQELGPLIHPNLPLEGDFLMFPAYLEIRHCFIEGCYISCILLVQLYIEQALGHSYILDGGEKLAEQGFAKLIDKALEDKLIDSTLTDQLHKLRQMRNPYVHPKAGDGDRTIIKRFLSKRRNSFEDLTREDAEIAIKIMVDYLRYRARRSGQL